MLWRGGCIIRAQFLDRIASAYSENAALENLMLAPYFSAALTESQTAWRTVVATAAAHGIPTPAS